MDIFAPMTAGDNRAAYEVRGDSMAPRFRSRDLLLIDTTDKTPADGGVFLVWVEPWAGYAVRGVKQGGGTVTLACENATYSAVEFDKGQVEVAGRVCGVWRNGGL